MTQKRPVSTKALSAYFTDRRMTLAQALGQIGLGDPTLLGETISDEIMGRLARRYGLTSERFAELVAEHTAAHAAE